MDIYHGSNKSTNPRTYPQYNTSPTAEQKEPPTDSGLKESKARDDVKTFDNLTFVFCWRCGVVEDEEDVRKESVLYSSVEYWKRFGNWSGYFHERLKHVDDRA